MEARGEKINVSSGPSKEVAGLKKMNMMKMMTPESQDSRLWEFSREALKQGRRKRGGWGGRAAPLFVPIFFFACM